MMQIGGVDSLILKDVKLPSEADQGDRKVAGLQEDDASKIREEKEAKKEREDAEEAKKAEDAEKAEKAVYGDVVGRSTDGDTTRVRKDAMEALETGMVFQKEEEKEDLMEYNRDQLTIMLDRGDITKNEYNHEITRRDEIMEKDEESAFAKSNAEMIEKQKEDAEKKAQEKAKERLDEITGRNDEEENETNENAERLENGMNALAAGVKGLEIEEEAVEKAGENGRSEIIDQILNPEDGDLKVIIK